MPRFYSYLRAALSQPATLRLRINSARRCARVSWHRSAYGCATRTKAEGPPDSPAPKVVLEILAQIAGPAGSGESDGLAAGCDDAKGWPCRPWCGVHYMPWYAYAAQITGRVHVWRMSSVMGCVDISPAASLGFVICGAFDASRSQRTAFRNAAAGGLPAR